MLRHRLQLHLPGLLLAALLILWAAQDGGYDPSTWYWGALLLLAATGVLALLRRRRLRLSIPLRLALGALALYVAFSYLSIAWAAYPGDALEGSNRALLYLLLFACVALLPWSAETALTTMLVFVLGVGVIALLLLARLATGHNLEAAFTHGRLVGPTGYFNASAALFSMTALMATALAAWRRLPGVVRGLLLAMAVAALQLDVLAQSRGWLFTLPLVLLAGALVVGHRLRTVAVAALAAVGVAAGLPKLLDVYRAYAHHPAEMHHAITVAGGRALLVCLVALLVGTAIGWLDELGGPVRLSGTRRRWLGWVVGVACVLAGTCGLMVGTHGHPFAFIKRQWNGFSHPIRPAPTGSYFAVVGSGRYDFWRVSLDAFAAHPLGGLGQDNFAEYYVRRRRTQEEPQWTHSLEMRLLAHTGAIGFLLFAAFLVAAFTAVSSVRRRGSERARWLAGAAMLPAIVWLVHGSVDWFWEMPALSGPALGLLAMAAVLERKAASAPEVVAASPRASWRVPPALGAAASGVAFLAALAALAFPYLSVRATNAAANLTDRDPARALVLLQRAADLNPLSAEPARLAGVIALQTGRITVARQRFAQAVQREPGGWFGWLGAGLSASAAGEPELARRDYSRAAAINSRQPAVTQALRRSLTFRPLSAAEAFNLLVLAQ